MVLLCRTPSPNSLWSGARHSDTGCAVGLRHLPRFLIQGCNHSGADLTDDPRMLEPSRAHFGATLACSTCKPADAPRTRRAPSISSPFRPVCTMVNVRSRRTPQDRDGPEPEFHRGVIDPEPALLSTVPAGRCTYRLHGTRCREPHVVGVSPAPATGPDRRPRSGGARREGPAATGRRAPDA